VVARPAQSRLEQVNEVKLVHEERVGRRFHVIPPSSVTSSTTEFASLVALTMHVSEFVQTILVTVSLEDHARGNCVDQLAPSSEE
jgi:hypothetical protein